MHPNAAVFTHHHASYFLWSLGSPYWTWHTWHGVWSADFLAPVILDEDPRLHAPEQQIRTKYLII